MARPRKHAAAIVLLVLGSWMSVEWWQSYRNLDYLTINGKLIVVPYRGTLRIAHQDNDAASPLLHFGHVAIEDDFLNPALDAKQNRSLAGFSRGTISFSNIQFVAIPFWFLLPIVFIPTLILARRDIRRNRRIKQGLCLICGYDLRASSWRCPECGTWRSHARSARP